MMLGINVVHTKRLLVLTVILLGGCSARSGTADLEQFTQNAMSKTPAAVEALPEFVVYEPFNYSASTLRSPFVSPLDEMLLMEEERAFVLAPDEDRPREFLEGFQLSTLRMVGTIARDGVQWALVQDPDLNIHRVTAGNYLGRNHGRINSVTEIGVEINEIVSTGNGNWVERPQSLVLEEL